MESFMGAQYAESIEGTLRRIENEGLLATVVRLVEMRVLGEWLVLEFVDEEVGPTGYYLLHPFHKPLPVGYVLVACGEDGGPLSKSEANAAVKLLREV